MLLEQILEANKRFCGQYIPQERTAQPQKKLAVITCMDCRLSGILEQAMGLEAGDAVFLKNAGNRISKNTADVFRSLAAAIFELGVEEVMVVGHTQCGMKSVDCPGVIEKMAERGIKVDLTSEEFEEWIGKIADEELNVKGAVDQLLNSEWLPQDIAIHGMLLELPTFKLKTIIKGY